MNDIVLSEQALQKAAAALRDHMVKDAPDTEDFHWEYSREFTAKAISLIARQRRRERYSYYARNIAAVFLAFIMTAGMLVGFNSDARAAIYGWVREIYEASAVYEYFGRHEPRVVLPEIEIGWLPDGYTLYACGGGENEKYITFYNGQDTFVLSYYSAMPEDVYEYQFISTHYKSQLVKIGDATGELYTPFGNEQDTYELIWLDESNGIGYQLSAQLSKTEMIHIANSIKVLP